MQFWGKVLSFLLWLLLIAVVFALLTVLSWWMQWPLLTGAAMLLGLCGLVLAFLGGRALLRWRDKRRFVRRVLDEQARSGIIAKVNGQMAEAWRQGIALLRHSPLLFQKQMQYGQPWFVVLDEAGDSALFESSGKTVPEHAAPLRWHFLSGSVLLRCPRPEESDWEELLASLARNRLKLPLRGVVLLLSARLLQEQSSEELQETGIRLRSRIQQLMLTLNKRYPVYILVEGLESLPGMPEVLGNLAPEFLNGRLGLELSGEAEGAGVRAAEAAAASLEDALRAGAVEGRFPRGDALCAVCALRCLGGVLEPVLENVSRSMAHQVTPLLRGVYFCQSASTEMARPGFLRNVLIRVLPAAGSAASLNGGLPFYAATRVMILSAWLLLTLALCGLFAANTLYQTHVLARDDAPPPSVSQHHPALNTLYDEMNFILQLEKARKSWLLPTFGQNLLLRVERETKLHYLSQVNAKLLTPMLSSFRDKLLAPSTGKGRDAGEQEMLKELMWMCSVMSDRIDGKTTSTNQMVYSLTGMVNSNWTPVTGQLLSNAFAWVPDGPKLTALSQELRDMLAMNLSHRGDLLTSLVNTANENFPGAKVCLSQFWSQMPAGAGGDVCVPPAYTTSGYGFIQDTLDDIASLGVMNQALKQQIESFRVSYFERYGKLWHALAVSFTGIPETMQQQELFSSYADIGSIESLPQVRMLRMLGEQLAPFKNATQKPSWISGISLLEGMVDFAIADQIGREGKDAGTGGWKSLLSIAGSSPELLQRLRAETEDVEQLRNVLEASRALNNYFRDIQELFDLFSNSQKALALAAIQYGGLDFGDPAGTPYAQAGKHLAEALKPFARQTDMPGKILLRGLLDFAAQGITVGAANELQRRWEDEVLASPAVLYRQDDVQALFGDKGVVHEFFSKQLKPFLKRQDKQLVAARWNDVAFPFTLDFLAALSRSELIAAEPPKESYFVLLRSQPTLVNVDARERVDSTEVSLQCQGREMRLVNRNYPRDEKFQYTVAQCGQATLEVRFPSFTLKRNFASFTEFLQEFQYGERVYAPDDFPDNAARLADAGIKEITVRILPDNASDVLQRRANQPPTLPDRITYTW